MESEVRGIQAKLEEEFSEVGVMGHECLAVDHREDLLNFVPHDLEVRESELGDLLTLLQLLLDEKGSSDTEIHELLEEVVIQNGL